MKRIYSLLVLSFGFTVLSFAQTRSVDMKLTTSYPSGGVVLVSANASQADQEAASINNIINITITNLGQDDITYDDTAIIGFRGWNGYAKIVIAEFAVSSTGKIYPGDSVSLTTSSFILPYEPTGATGSSFVPAQQICDTLWMVDVAGNVIDDPDLSNNHSCQNISISTWFLNVTDINDMRDFNIYPNPASNVMNLTYNFKGAKNISLVVRDVVGKTVINQNLGTNLNGTQKFTVDISSLTNGMYIVEFNVDGKKQVKRITVQK